MKIWMIYKESDYLINSSYVSWFQEEGIKLGVDVELILVDYLDFAIEKSRLVLRVSGNVIDKPDAVINRSRNWKISYILENWSIPVYNTWQTTMIANDKLMAYNKVSALGVRTMAMDTSNVLESGLVYKSRYGHGGDQVFLIDKDNIKEFENIISKEYIRQELLRPYGKDIRVYVMGGKIIASVLRTSQNGFKSNFKLGGNISLYELNGKQKEIVNIIKDSMKLDYVGIDFLIDESDELIFNEIEDPVGSRMLSKLTDINIAKMFLENIIASKS